LYGGVNPGGGGDVFSEFLTPEKAAIGTEGLGSTYFTSFPTFFVEPEKG
jgi:hypothetical protein